MIDFNKPKHLVIGMHYGDPPAPTANESTADVLSAYINYLPALMQTGNAQTLPTAQSNLDASKVISPQQNQLMLDLYKQFAPQLAEVGSNVDNISRTNTANTDVNLLKNQGADLANAYKGIDQNLNPEYYATRANESKQIGGMLDAAGQAVNQPDVEAERLISQEANRTGNDIAPNATNTVSNAISFGDERAKRIGTLSNAISTATQFLQPASNAQFNPATAILNKPTSGSGTNQFAGIADSSAQTASQTGNILNNINGLQQSAMNINANRRDTLDRINGTTSSILGSL